MLISLSLRDVTAYILALSSLILTRGFPASAGDGSLRVWDDVDPKEFVGAIHSVQQVKDGIREALEEVQTCAAGSCYNMISSNICDVVGALDIKLGGKIIDTDHGGSKPELDISDSDLRLMKLIMAQCKPTHYQYWNFDRVLHLSYSPSAEASHIIDEALGVKKKTKR